jgi:hypothetical protein
MQMQDTGFKMQVDPVGAASSRDPGKRVHDL